MGEYSGGRSGFSRDYFQMVNPIAAKAAPTAYTIASFILDLIRNLATLAERLLNSGLRRNDGLGQASSWHRIESGKKVARTLFQPITPHPDQGFQGLVVLR